MRDGSAPYEILTLRVPTANGASLTGVLQLRENRGIPRGTKS